MTGVEEFRCLSCATGNAGLVNALYRYVGAIQIWRQTVLARQKKSSRGEEEEEEEEEEREHCVQLSASTATLREARFLTMLRELRLRHFRGECLTIVV